MTHESARTDDVLTEAELATVWRRVQDGRRTRRRRRLQRTLAISALLALLALLGARGLSNESVAPDPRPLARADGEALASLQGLGRTLLEEGSRIETSADAELEVLENTRSTLVTALRRGRARFEVTPGTGRRWRVESAGVIVEVVGTVFTVDRDERRVRVEVHEGVVLVQGDGVPAGARRLTAGAQLEVPLEAVAPPELAPASLDAPEPPSTTRAPRPRRSAQALLADADRARREGRLADAMATLTSLVEAHPRAPEAPLAAFTLARLHERAGRTDEAARWYRRALALGLAEPLAESARHALEAREPAQ